MKIRVLGASGSDLPGQNLTSFLLDSSILLDAGGVTNSLSLKEQLKLKHIFVTHAHLDHIRDIPFLADNFILSQSNSQITVLSIREVLDDIKKHLLNQRLWPDFTMIPSETQSIVKLERIKENTPVIIGNYTVTAYRMAHTVPAVGFLIQNSENKSLFYTGDTGPTEDTWKKIPDIQLDALIIEVSFPNRMNSLARITGHLTPELLIDELKKLPHMPKQTFITHVKSQFRAEIERELSQFRDTPLTVLSGGEIIEL